MAKQLTSVKVVSDVAPRFSSCTVLAAIIQPRVDGLYLSMKPSEGIDTDVQQLAAGGI